MKDFTSADQALHGCARRLLRAGWSDEDVAAALTVEGAALSVAKKGRQATEELSATMAQYEAENG